MKKRSHLQAKMRQSVLLKFILARVTQHDFLWQSDAVFQKNWRLLSLLRIFELLVK